MIVMPTVTLELSDSAYEQVRDIAHRTGKPVEVVLSEWVNRFADDVPVELLSDEQVLALADTMLPQHQQEELDNLLTLQNVGNITKLQQQRLDELMAIYRRGLVRKAQAMKVAVERGLRSR
jgi:hypothetical protein